MKVGYAIWYNFQSCAPEPLLGPFPWHHRQHSADNLGKPDLPRLPDRGQIEERTDRRTTTEANPRGADPLRYRSPRNRPNLLNANQPQLVVRFRRLIPTRLA